MRYNVWSSPAQFTYSTNLLSRATVFHLLTTLLMLIPPLLLAYRSQGFWVRSATYREQPEVHFKHQLILVANLASGGTVGWSTVDTVNDFLLDAVRIPLVKSREEDVNRDGVMDSLSISMEMPVGSDEEVVSVSGLLVFDVKLHK